MQVLSIQNNERYNYKQTFKSLTPKSICSDLCKGACCNEGTPTSAAFKTITDSLWVQSKIKFTNPKEKRLIRRNICKWLVKSDNPDVITANDYANECIQAILTATNKADIIRLKKALNALNAMLCELMGNKEAFIAVTDSDAVNLPLDDFIDREVKNMCMYKDDHTNLCTIYDGVKDETGKKIGRPSACLKVGREWPCLWFQPDLLMNICDEIKAELATDRDVDPDEIDFREVMRYIEDNYKLNGSFWEKIWKPFIENKYANS